MELLPLTSVIFSLFAGAPDMSGPVSDTKDGIVSCYIGKQSEEPRDDSITHKGDETDEGVSLKKQATASFKSEAWK